MKEGFVLQNVIFNISHKFIWIDWKKQDNRFFRNNIAGSRTQEPKLSAHARTLHVWSKLTNHLFVNTERMQDEHSRSEDANLAEMKNHSDGFKFLVFDRCSRGDDNFYWLLVPNDWLSTFFLSWRHSLHVVCTDLSLQATHCQNLAGDCTTWLLYLVLALTKLPSWQ